jgi:hypothetical protein
VAEEPQQVVQQAVKAADEVQKELHEVSRRLLEVQRYLRDERGHGRAAPELRQARSAAARGSKPPCCPGSGVAYGYESGRPTRC